MAPAREHIPPAATASNDRAPCHSWDASPRGASAAPAPAGPPGPCAPRLIGRSPAFLELLRQARRVAVCRIPVLILGESGSGKEGIARTLHLESSRRDAPFLALNCASIPETLLESELFGAARGAYTGADADRLGLFQMAHGGTLFLDEVGDMPLPMQAKLLRVLQDGKVRPVGGRSEQPVDVRIVAATHRHLPSMVETGQFRVDLYYRLAVVELRVPPLRERREDIPLLASHLLDRLRFDTSTARARLDDSALQKLESHDWPGNVRELEAVLARALLTSGGGDVSAWHIAILPRHEQRAIELAQPGQLEKIMIHWAIREMQGNLSRAAARIGWSRQKLYRRMKALGIPRPA